MDDGGGNGGGISKVEHGSVGIKKYRPGRGVARVYDRRRRDGERDNLHGSQVGL